MRNECFAALEEINAIKMEFTNIEVEELIFILVGIMIILMNSVEIAFLLRIKHRSTFEKLLLSLALSDLLVGIAVTVFKTIDFATDAVPWLEEDEFVTVFIMSSIFSLKNLLAITADRFLAVKYPIKHHIFVTGRRVNILIVLIWVVVCLFGILTNIIIIVGFGVERRYFMILSTVAILTWGILITVLYGAILRVLFTRQTTKDKADDRNRTVLQKIQLLLRGRSKSERAVLCSSIIVSGSFIVCTYPFAIEYLKTKDTMNMSLESRMLMILNSFLNPFIYFFNRSLGQRRTNNH